MPAFDIVAFFANPVFVGKVLLIWVSAWTTIFYLIPRKLIKEDMELYWRGLAFVAEILVIGGLLGLFTFAGRTKIELNAKQNHEILRDSEKKVQDALIKLTYSYCVPSEAAQAPFRSVRGKPELCSLLRTYGPMFQTDLDWKKAKVDLDKIHDESGADNRLATMTKTLALSVEEMVAARSTVSATPSQDDYIFSKNSWIFILTCAICAMLGVSMKCARTFKEFWTQFSSWRINRCSS